MSLRSLQLLLFGAAIAWGLFPQWGGLFFGACYGLLLLTIVLGLVLRRDRGTSSPRPSPWRPRTFFVLTTAAGFALAIVWGGVYVRRHAPAAAIARIQSAPGDSAAVQAVVLQELRHHPSDYLLYLAAATRFSAPPALDLKRAMRFANRAQYLNGPSHKPHLVTARILAQLGRPSQAALEYRLAARRQSTLWERCFAEVARWPNGLRWMRELADEPALQVRLARFLRRANRADDARVVLDAHLALAPSDGEALGLAARLELGLGRVPAALRWLERLERLPAHTTTALLLRARAQIATNQQGLALATYALLRAQSPLTAEAYLGAAGLHLTRNEGALARALLEALLKVDVKATATAHFGILLAHAYELEGSPALALREYRLVLAREPTNGEARARVVALEKTLDGLGTQ